MSAADVVREFCAAWEQRDADLILSYFAPDATYHNIPVEPAVGHEAIRAVLDLFVPTSRSIRFEIRNLVAEGDRVFTERVDHFEFDDGRTVALPVAGVFEIADGRIAAWRDYFDLQSFFG
jgi:limonene-1,2-epoxide hydrolase